MIIPFQKFHGAGNDFVVVDNRRRPIRRASDFARKVCDRHRGIGADGLLLVERSRIADYRMMYYNADGSYGGMCGNGGRCIAMFAFMSGIAKRQHRFEALGHVYDASILGKGIASLRMKAPKGLSVGISLKNKGRSFVAHFVDTGSPHVVIPLSGNDLDRLDIVTVGRWIRNHRRFKPAGTNANFIERTGPKSLRMRTYERGVEAETLACGTGSVASAIVAAEIMSMRSPVTILARSGDRLRVSFTNTHEGYQNVHLRGPVVMSFSGGFHV